MSEPQQPSPQTSNWDELTSLRFPGNQPSKEASARLYDELQFQRACQVYLWALPAMNMVAMRDGQAAAFGSGNNVLAIWKDRISAKTIISTANPDVIYGLAFVDLKDGPLVFEAAPRASQMRQPSRVIAVGLVLVDLPMAWPHRCSRGLPGGADGARRHEPLALVLPAIKGG